MARLIIEFDGPSADLDSLLLTVKQRLGNVKIVHECVADETVQESIVASWRESSSVLNTWASRKDCHVKPT